LRSIAVYCGSSSGHDPQHAAVAKLLGAAMAQRGIALVYGGASVGLMGLLADAALAGGGRVVGVIPRMLQARELAHHGLAELHITETMQERKTLMAERSDGFLAIPGGIGTLDELFEMWTWRQLGLHNKPFGLLNLNGYYDSLLAFLDRSVTEGFLRRETRELLIVAEDVPTLLDALQSQAQTPSP
jgi:uncharacterized protein (TIGR00730 family)